MRASLYGVIVCSVLATACGKKVEVNVSEVMPTTGANATATTAAKPEADAATAPEADVKPAVEVATAPAHVPLNNETYAVLVKAIGSCKLVGTMIDPQCPAAMTLQKELSHKDTKVDAEVVRALGLELITSEVPALRVKASELLESRLGGSQAGQEAILQAYAKEGQQPVKLAFMRALGTYASLDAKAANALIAALSDADMDVRANAIYALTEPLNTTLPGVAEAFMKAIEKDPEPKLRRVACEHVGKLGDEKLLPLIAKMTDAKADPEMQESCMRGLVDMWADYPRFQNASERAYRLTLRLLERKPRTAKIPSWTALERLAKLAKLRASESSLTPGEALAVKSWKARAKGWFDEKDLQLPLREIVLDPNVAELAVAKAIEALDAVGATKEELESLRKMLSTSPRMTEKGPVANAFAEVLNSGKSNRAGETAKPTQGVKITGPTGVKITGPTGVKITGPTGGTITGPTGPVPVLVKDPKAPPTTP